MKPGEGQDPASVGSQSEEKKYSEKELNEKVSAVLGAKLGPIPAETLEVFQKDPRMLNKMLVAQTIIDGDPALREKVERIMAGNLPENRVQLPSVDFDRILADAQAESGVELDEKTRKILGSFTKKLGIATMDAAKNAGGDAARAAAPAAVEQMTRDQQWEWVRAQEEYKGDKQVMRATRDILNEAFATKQRMTPHEAFEQAKKEVAELRGGGKNAGGQASPVSQPRQSNAQAAGLRGAAPIADSGTGPGGSAPTKKISYREHVAQQIDDAQFRSIVDAAQKRFG